MGAKISVRYRQDFDLKKVMREVKRPTKTLRAIGGVRRDDFNYIIDRNLDPSHKKVARLSPAYRRVKPPGKKIRELTGDLIASYRQKIRGNELIEELTDPKASFHQEGTRNIPQRKMLPTEFNEMTSRVRKKILSILADTIIKNL